MTIATISIGSVSAALVVCSLDDPDSVETGYQEVMRETYYNGVKWDTPVRMLTEIYAMCGVPHSFIVVDVRIDRDMYRLGEPVNVSITVTNTGHNTTLLFPNSQLADLNITDDTRQHIYQWSYDKLFLEEITEITINQSETIELLNDAWDQVDDAGNLVTPGKYYIDGWMIRGLHNSCPETHDKRLEIVVYSGQTGPSQNKKPRM